MSGADATADTAVDSVAQKEPISQEMAAFCSSLVISFTPCNYFETEGVGFHIDGPERDQIVADIEKYCEGSFSHEAFVDKWAHLKVQD